MTASELALQIKGLHKSFGDFHALDDINLDIRSGEFVVFVGPSGCGKSTLLRIIAGLEHACAGDITIAGRRVNDVEPSRRDIAMVFQSYALYPHLDVRGNLSLGLKQARKPASFIEAQVGKAAKMLALDELLHRRPSELSGGQRQRVAIGRALVREPHLFLLDEPLSNLDAALRVNTRLEIARLHRDTGKTMIYVTHDQIEAMTLADKIVVMNKGRIEQIGSPMELYRHPANTFVARFIGSPQMNLFPGSKVGMRDVRLVGIRPEHLAITTNDGPLQGAVSHVEHLGADTNVYIEVADIGLIVARVSGDVEARAGDFLRLEMRPDRVHRFDEQARRFS
ncbi:ABC transporter ATP-binding protein [Sinorhizobium fredii]|uniref:Sugar ABC transporter ATP-binding protein n=1 Tax=Rhizobium fredii TaxID=380 RepID=A0A2L0HCY0_RHIFR|nr:ABC transporter ATP-binding protein [Sinorhizobium fredii]AUX79351.1 sugar ABC transporter ATP-binding protein [Sinorhizobium fredii]